MGRNDPCPCGTGRAYAACCAKLHDREREPHNGEELVRSRYSAFARGKVDYLYETLHEDHPDKGRPRDQVLLALRTASSTFKYMGLVIIESQPEDRDGVSRVLYLARIFRRGEDVSFVELAEFLSDGNGLRYRSGRTAEAAGMRVPPPDLTIATFKPSDR